MDHVVVESILAKSNAATQVIMSMVCKQWASVARYHSMRYKTLGKAVAADSSIAITRILQEGLAAGNKANLDDSTAGEYVQKGNSIAFARASGCTIYSMEPYYSISSRGCRYANWLIDNNVNKIHRREHNVAIALAIGCKTTIVTCKRLGKRRPSWYAVVLYANGHHGLCWPLDRDEIRYIANCAKCIPWGVFMSDILPYIERITCPIINRMTPDQIACVAPDLFENMLYVCKSREIFEAVTKRNLGLACCTKDGELFTGDVLTRFGTQFIAGTSRFDMIAENNTRNMRFLIRVTPEKMQSFKAAKDNDLTVTGIFGDLYWIEVQ